MVNYYKILEVEANASMAEVKAAFRRLALLYHPDRNADVRAVEKFTLIQKAYEVLGNKDSRLRHDLQLQLKIPVFDAETAAPTLFITDRIWLKVSRKKVKPGETFSVIIRTYRRFKEPILQGQEQFELVNYYSQVITIQDRPMREVLFVFKATKEGTYAIGPARMRQGQYEYLSASYDIEVSDEGGAILPIPKKAISVMLLAFFAFVIFALSFDFYVRKQREKAYMQHTKELIAEQAERNKQIEARNLKTGFSPYDDYFGEPAYDTRIFHKIMVVDNLNMDALVLIQNTVNGKVIRNYYVKGRDTLVIGEMPPGSYQVKAEIGVGWDKNLSADGGQLKGNFSLPVQYLVMDQPSQQIKIVAENPGDSSNYHIFGFHLFDPDEGIRNANVADEKEFFGQ